MAWLPGVPLAMASAFIRNTLYLKFMNELQAQQFLDLSFALLVGIYAYFVLQWLKVTEDSEAQRIGYLWLGLTVAFEFIFGHFVMGNSWTQLFNEYNLRYGRIWVLVLVWIMYAPLVLNRLKKRFHK